MIYTIKKGKHRAWPLRFGFIFRKRISMRVTFLPSCKYDLGHPDQLDWNKLFGVGFFPGHHRNSHRFAWRYNPDSKKIEIAGYYYENGVRQIHYLCSVNIMEQVILEIGELWANVTYVVNGELCLCLPVDWPWISYRLGLYFGGNRPAPHDIKIEMK